MIFSIISVCRRKDDVEIHDEIESGPSLGDENHSKNGTVCNHEQEECTLSIEIDKDKINQGMKAKHNTKVTFYKLNRIINQFIKGEVILTQFDK